VRFHTHWYCKNFQVDLDSTLADLGDGEGTQGIYLVLLT
jgi:hypothetical protein